MWLFGKKKEHLQERNMMLLEWQNTILEEPVSKLIMTETQLDQQTRIIVKNELRIIKDCLEILETTTKPDIFFPRLELLEKKTSDLVKVEKYVTFNGAKPSEALTNLFQDKQKVINDFLIRYFCSVFDKAETMKTDKGKLNQYIKFYDSLKPYYDIMDADNIDYIETKYNAYTRSLKKG